MSTVGLLFRAVYDRRNQPRPSLGLKVLEAGFGNRGHIGQFFEAVPQGCCKCAQFLGAYLFADIRIVHPCGGQVPAQNRADNRCVAGVWDERSIHIGRLPQRFECNVLSSTGTNTANGEYEESRRDRNWHRAPPYASAKILRLASSARERSSFVQACAGGVDKSITHGLWVSHAGDN
jgi:hypothetical protein